MDALNDFGLLHDVIDRAALVLEAQAKPRVAVTPKVGASPVGSVEFGDGSGDVRYLRYTVGAGDDLAARDRLRNGYPDASMINPDSTVVIHADAPITRLDIVAIGDTESAATIQPGELVVELGGGSTEAEFELAMFTLTFDEIDNVRTVILTASQLYSATAAPATSANWCRLNIEGRSHG